MSWRVLDFTSFEGKLRYRRGRVSALYLDGQEKSVSLSEVATVIVSSNVSISSGLMIKFGELGIPLLITDWKFVPITALNSWSAHSRVGSRQIAQANMTLPRRKQAWAQLVRAKVSGQASCLAAIGQHECSKHLRTLSSQVKSGDSSNIEAQAARYYWAAYSRDPKFQRNQDASDFINGALNYGYTVLRGCGIRAVSEAGLWPALGVFHHSRSNAFCLVDDLIEPFRPVVDWLVSGLDPKDGMNSSQVRKSLASCTEIPFDSSGYTVHTALNELAKSYGLYAEGNIPKLNAKTWSNNREVAQYAER